jgi:hypothetical protein
MTRLAIAVMLCAGPVAAGVAPLDLAPGWTECWLVSPQEAARRAAETPLRRSDLGPALVGPWIDSRPVDIFADINIPPRVTREDVRNSRPPESAPPAASAVPLPPAGTVFAWLLLLAAAVLLRR